MVKTIGNPLSWSGNKAGGIGGWLARALNALGSDTDMQERITVQRIGRAEIREALRLGLRDFGTFRTDVLFLVLIYPVIGILMTMAAFHLSLLPLVFPVASGFALVGPVLATELYAMSKAHAEGRPTTLRDVGHIFTAEVLAPVLVLGAFLTLLFVIWVGLASAIHAATLGPQMPQSVSGFLRDVLTTTAGWEMIALGMGVGFVFALLVLVTSLTAFPMLVDRPVGLPVAVLTSLRVARRNPITVAGWGLLVALLLLVGSLPLFIGLVIVLPVLGHATWHLYRSAVVIEDPAA